MDGLTRWGFIPMSFLSVNNDCFLMLFFCGDYSRSQDCSCLGCRLLGFGWHDSNIRHKNRAFPNSPTWVCASVASETLATDAHTHVGKIDDLLQFAIFLCGLAWAMARIVRLRAHWSYICISTLDTAGTYIGGVCIGVFISYLLAKTWSFRHSKSVPPVGVQCTGSGDQVTRKPGDI